LRTFIFVVLLLISTTSTVRAQQSDSGLARFTILIPKEGMQKQFEEGYKRHLKWHVDNGDAWNWYGWFIISGARRGYFIDTTFGHTWADFDKPVNPAADVADLEINVTPFARVFGQFTCSALPAQSLGTREELSTALPQVVYFKIKPGQESTFEQFMASMRNDFPKIAPEQKFLWYRVEDGEQTPQFLLFLPHKSYADMQSTQNFLARLWEQNKAAQTMFQNSVSEVVVETMRYRADLTYLPK
jgi:hypothetical protein